MKFMFFSFGMIYTLLFFFMNHPLSLGFMLMIQTLWISIMIGYMSKSFWFSYILFITFLGGMLILFIYMTSLSTNENFNFSLLILITLMIMFTLSVFFIYKTSMNLSMNYFSNNDSYMNNLKLINLNILNLNKLYNFPENFLTFLLILYLFMAMLIMTKITENFKGPMRKNS